jgi:hypothetical protein
LLADAAEGFFPDFPLKYMDFSWAGVGNIHTESGAEVHRFTGGSDYGEAAGRRRDVG